jgi:ubiquinone/menaquinone biosynthesis C-methylase UbiE
MTDDSRTTDAEQPSLPATLTPADLEELCCPACHGGLAAHTRGLACQQCSAVYPTVHGFVDFGQIEITDSARTLADDIAARYADMSFTELIAYHYAGAARRAGAEDYPGRLAHFEAEQRHYLQSLDRFGEWHWRGAEDEVAKLPGAPPARRRALDIGCGWGRDLRAIAQTHDRVWGIDILPHSLLYARKLLEERGLTGTARLILADVGRLPFRDATFDFVNASAVIEHVPDPAAMHASVERVLRPGGWYHFYYPNRFSLLHETHTSLWGVGFLPRRLQLWWVRRRCGIDFSGTRLYSSRAMRRLIARHFRRALTRVTGLTSGTGERALASKYSTKLGRRRLERLIALYAAVDRVPILADLAFLFLPIHYVTCRKEE